MLDTMNNVTQDQFVQLNQAFNNTNMQYICFVIKKYEFLLIFGITLNNRYWHAVKLERQAVQQCYLQNLIFAWFQWLHLML